MEDKTIVLAADHNGVELKRHLHGYLKSKGYNPIDLGPFDDVMKVDYPDFASQVGQMVHKGDVKKGILICGTGVGMSIVANKFQNVRAALIHNLESAPKSREHNDANILCLGAWVTTPKASEEIIDSWLGESFGEGRHVKRIEKIMAHNPHNIVFTNGIFDILHTGHIELFKFAKMFGDKLIVAINSDKAVRELKGPGRPLNNEEERKKAIEAIKYVDEVVIFDNLETINIINQIHPHIVVKGSEWTADEVRKRDKIPNEIEVKIFPLVKEYSTTGFLKKVSDGLKEELKIEEANKKKKVVFTNGVFDILHTGHIELFKFAKSLGDKLIVAINSDRAVKEFKGPNRPINNQDDRKKALESIKYVDEVVIFDDTDPARIRDNLMPDILVKGGEWTPEEVRYRDKVPLQTDVVIFPFVKGYSTTSTLQKIQEKNTWQKKEDNRF